MKTVSAVSRLGFRSRDRAMGMVGAWTAFVVNEAYAVISGLGYLSVKNPSDPISDPYLSIMSLLIVLMAPFLVITMVAVHTYAAAELKPYSLAALAFMILLAGITSSINFALFAVTRQPTPAPALWVPSFVSSRWPPLPQALDFFAWDWFFALSMLLAASVFRGSRLENAVRVLMLPHRRALYPGTCVAPIFTAASYCYRNSRLGGSRPNCVSAAGKPIHPHPARPWSVPSDVTNTAFTLFNYDV